MQYTGKTAKVLYMAGQDKPGRVFICQSCGKESLKWLGHCPNCQQWNSFVESAPAAPSRIEGSLPRELSGITLEEGERFSTALGELDRVLGGGLVPGSLVLVAGDPGIGKSTLLLQLSALVASHRGQVLYVSGEETVRQIKLRAGRLGMAGEGLYLLAETDLEAILSHLEKAKPALVVIDSIQTVYLRDLDSAAGSVNQVRECTVRLMRWAKESAVPVVIAGHVTKEGAVAGPRTLEHIVDTVLYLEGEPFSSYRLLRGVKNRFGSTNEVGVFEMTGRGLVEVDNPSRAFLSRREEAAAGSVVVPTLEGSRPLLVEVQALTSPTSFGLPRRTANGVDFNRLLIIIAVLSRQAGVKLGNQDIIANVAGGMKIEEPAADLGVALAIASSFRDISIDTGLVAVGEVGLGGELRRVAQLERRIAEAARLGFRRCLAPRSNSGIPAPDGMKILSVGTLREAVKVGLGNE